MDENLLNSIAALVGDTPVSVQIQMALDYHIHKNYVTRDEFESLRQQVELLSALVGDTTVAEQISAAINTAKR